MKNISDIKGLLHRGIYDRNKSMQNSEVFMSGQRTKKAHVIVVGNEKGGSGKSTVAMHLAVGLLRLGYSVGTVDLDSHQATLTSYFKNRWQYMRETGENIPSPEHVHIDRADGADVMVNRDEERWRVEAVLAELSGKDFIVVDTPGSDRYMGVIGHSFADTLVTPLNDSFLDLDVLVRRDADTREMTGPSIYTQMVQDLKIQRQKRDGGTINWFVMRNRLSALNTKNKEDVGSILASLQGRFGYALAPGFSERVIFRELFLQGRTLLDLREGDRHSMSLSNVNARQEVRHLVRMILPQKDVSTLSLLKTY